MVSIPVYTNHDHHPLDRSVYRSFKMAFEKIYDTIQKNCARRRVIQFDVAGLVCTEYNRNLSAELDFALACVYENAPPTENACAALTEG